MEISVRDMLLALLIITNLCSGLVFALVSLIIWKGTKKLETVLIPTKKNQTERKIAMLIWPLTTLGFLNKKHLPISSISEGEYIILVTLIGFFPRLIINSIFLILGLSFQRIIDLFKYSILFIKNLKRALE